MKPIFQFSSFENESYINDKLVQAIKRLGGNYDESKVNFCFERSGLFGIYYLQDCV